jgi:hypothetical protein
LVESPPEVAELSKISVFGCGGGPGGLAPAVVSCFAFPFTVPVGNGCWL